MKLSLSMHKHIIVRQLIYSYKTFALFTRGLFKSQLAKQRMPKQAKSSTAKVWKICQEYPDEFSATPARDLRCNPLRRVSQMRQKVFCGKPPKKYATPKIIEDEEQIPK